MSEKLKLKYDKNEKIYSHIRKKYLVATPEEIVRQNFLLELVNDYNYDLEQIAEEESVVGRGSAQARADFLIWKTKEDRINDNPAFIVVECKADYITISNIDYQQGENYARREGAEIFITHNSKETKIFKVLRDKRPGYLREIERIPQNGIEKKELQELYNSLKEFKEDEFADTLHSCHNIIRNREKLDPAAAFDEIAKILFMKVWAERNLTKGGVNGNIFSSKWIEEAEKYTTDFLQKTFEDTKKNFVKDKLFAKNEKINLRNATIKAIVKELENYNLSKTSTDIKGIAFERFLGRTFRHEIGQFFTPRPVVEFMVDMLDPEYGKIICDPASGSGGFLIRVFEKIRAKIEADINKKYFELVDEIYKKDFNTEELKELNKLKELKVLTKKEEVRLAKLEKKEKKVFEKNAKYLTDRREELFKDLDQSNKESKLQFLSNKSIYGTDANDRMARTSKMNMIMHGDGHGGIHHHDGFINVNGIFENRFDYIFTNPPFGSKVEKDDKIRIVHITPEETEKEYKKLYGEQYIASQEKIKNNINKSVLSLYTLPKYDAIKTELLFVERNIDLLKEKGKLGIVLPEMFFSDPDNLYVRNFIEDNAKLLSVISLPEETFVSSKATVKTSVLFIQKFSSDEKEEWETVLKEEFEKITKLQEAERNEINTILNKRITQKSLLKIDEYNSIYKKDKSKFKELFDKLNNELKDKKKKASIKLKELDKYRETESRSNGRKRFDYLVFMAEVKHSGITTTGSIEEDENELPSVVTDYHNYLKTKKSKKYLVENYSDLGKRWDVKSRTKLLFPNPDKYPLVKIGDFLTRNKTSIDIVDDKTYKRVTIKLYNQGLFLRDEKNGKKIGTKKQFTIKEGQFLLSKIDAKSGAFGVVPNELDNAIITGNFWTFDVNTNIVNPEYFRYLTNSDSFTAFCEVNSIGTTNRKYLQEDLFLDYNIPLPDKVIQDKIIKEINIIERQIEALKEEKQKIVNKHF